MTDWPLNEIVEVEWGDAHAQPGWLNPNEQDIALNPLPTKSVGYLWQKTKTAVVLMNTQNSGQIGGIQTIPMGMVRKIRKVSV